MRKFLALAAAASALALSAPASAQVWQSINQRQANLDERIDAGVRDGSLTRVEAMRLRGEFNDLSRLEASYRYSGGGLSLSERMDLDRRFNALSSQIRYQRSDDQHRGGYGRGDNGWQPINARQRELDLRIDQGLRNGSLSRVEAARLRMQFDTIARLEASYRRGGLNNYERADLERRMDRLNARIFAEERDRNNYFG
jgi:hypothetical protein